MKSTISTILIMLTLLTGVAAASEDGTPSKVIPYKQIGDVELELHVFLPEGHSPSGKRPAIVFFFGGGWNGGSPSQFYPHSAYFASRGIVAIAAEYRIKSLHDTPPSACVQDGKSAIRWIRSHADELGVDSGRIIASGGSAGGHVAAATVLGFNEEGEDLGVSCIPDALVLFNPVFDNGPDGYGYDRVRDYWQAFSPMHNLNAKTPPTIFFLGTSDHLIPVATAEDYKKRMEKLGIRCDLHLYEGQEHGFFNYRNREYFDRTVCEADKFLTSLGYLQVQATTPEK